MSIRSKRAWRGTAAAAVATVADPDAATGLTFYDAAGNPVPTGTSGAAYVATNDQLRGGDTAATLFVYTPRPDQAGGAWSGAQLTATKSFPAGGAPSSLSGKQYYAVGSGELSLADYVSGVDTSSTADGYSGVYELRLRTSSATKGVGTTYGSAFVRTTDKGATWTVTTAPTTGGSTGTPTTPAPTTPAPTTAPAPPVVAKVAPGKVAVKISKKPTAKKAGKATVTVAPSSGRAQPTGRVTVTIKGKATKRITASLAGGRKAVTLPKLKKGSYKVTVSYAGDASYLGATSRPLSLKVK